MRVGQFSSSVIISKVRKLKYDTKLRAGEGYLAPVAYSAVKCARRHIAAYRNGVHPRLDVAVNECLPVPLFADANQKAAITQAQDFMKLQLRTLPQACFVYFEDVFHEAGPLRESLAFFRVAEFWDPRVIERRPPADYPTAAELKLIPEVTQVVAERIIAEFPLYLVLARSQGLLGGQQMDLWQWWWQDSVCLSIPNMHWAATTPLALVLPGNGVAERGLATMRQVTSPSEQPRLLADAFGGATVLCYNRSKRLSGGADTSDDWRRGEF